MIEPLYSLLQQLARDRRSGMLLLVMTASGSAAHIVTVWLSEGELVHVSGRLRKGAEALMLLRHARLLRRWQWFDLAAPDDLKVQELPRLQDFLSFESRYVVPAPPEGAPATLEQVRLERLFAIQTFLQTMGGLKGADVFMELIFEHPPSLAWDELMEAFRDHLAQYFGDPVARQVVDA
ncbi:hypothetical protein [Hydrogenophaga sp. IBVHS2]|uniref:hypothetical protein n=1 Tax=Hydrogenophaga sp. IBVHS2 TaxID=1985170 RepID=UPI000A2EBE67|nr:hypothetical protein [Hydrogenophaga sp. IBVHS2]OSZ64670.1 hypothetical protein CAP38_09715 [Hydrogenophaga sp. IBVHS2]